jgi:hypothetical protein
VDREVRHVVPQGVKNLPKVTMAEGKGALLLAEPNFSRPRMKWIYPFFAYSCHQRVSTRAGSRQTTSAPFWDSSHAFFTHRPISLPYGGFTTVFFFGKKSLAFGILRGGTWVERESAEDKGEFIEQCLRRWPFWCCARKMDAEPRNRLSGRWQTGFVRRAHNGREALFYAPEESLFHRHRSRFPSGNCFHEF